MGLLDDLVIILSSYSGGYRHIRSMINGYRRETYPPDSWRVVDESIRVALSRLKKKGFVENRNRIWRATEKGKIYAEALNCLPYHSKKRVMEASSLNLIIAFDIPELIRKKRNWLREELKCLGFVRLQQSVWLGHAPLPEEFLDKLKILQLLTYMKFFHVEEEDIV